MEEQGDWEDIETETRSLRCTGCGVRFFFVDEETCEVCGAVLEIEDSFDDDYGDPGDMDGDHGSALASAGMGVDEDYGGGYYDDDF